MGMVWSTKLAWSLRWERLGWECVDEFEMERVTFRRIEVDKNERGKQAFALNESYSGCIGPSFAL
jgi:hypothetical protein